MKINFQIAIDFTASNGVVTNPSSLHFIDIHNPDVLNSYEKAITSVGSILLNYDNDKLVPVFGFGGIPNDSKDNLVSHCFPLNGV